VSGQPPAKKTAGQIEKETLKKRISNKIKRQLFGILNFGHCDLFVICDLLFEIF